MTSAKKPVRVYLYTRASEDDTPTDSRIEYVVIHETDISKYGDYKRKWIKISSSSKDESEESRRLQLFLNVFNSVNEKLVLDPEKNEWKKVGESEILDLEGVDNLLEGLVGKIEDEVEAKKIAEEDAIIKEHTVKYLEGLRKSVPRRKHFMESVEYHTKVALKGVKSAYEMVLLNELGNTILIAMKNKMHDAVARAFIERLLEAASYVCFEDDYVFKYITSMNVGTSPYHKEGFPVCTSVLTSDDIVLSQEAKQVPQTPPKRNLQFGSSKKGSPSVSKPSSCASPSVHSSYGSPQKSSHTMSTRGGGGRLYSDCIAILKTKMPVYILVVEIKSVAIKQADTTQLRKQMIGAGIHQNEVFGLLIGPNEACLHRMMVNSQTKELIFVDTASYDFLSLSDLTRLFLSLVAVMDYGNSNIIAQNPLN